MLDKNLRNSVMSAMQDLEEHIKETAASVVAETFGTNEENYLDYRNYRNKKKRKKRFTLPGILDTLKKTLETGKDSAWDWSGRAAGFPWCIDQRWLSGTANISTCTDFPGNCYRTDYGMLQYSGRRTS